VIPETSWATRLPAEQIPAALTSLASLQGILAARLMVEPRAESAPIEEIWISVEDASKKLHRSPRWFYRNAKRLPFVKRLSRKVLLVGEKGMGRWIATQKA
jgi:hypothetical protein